MVLVVPYWNVNYVDVELNDERFISFSSTILECKYEGIGFSKESILEF